jgi:hypothetical protein
MSPETPVPFARTPWQVSGKQQKAVELHLAPVVRQVVAAQTPALGSELVAQDPEQHAALVLQADGVGPHVLVSDPESGGPAQQLLSCSPQLSTQLPEQPVFVQHILLLPHSWPPEHPHACGTPHESGTATPHWPLQRLVGVQHLLFDPHSWPLEQPPLH